MTALTALWLPILLSALFVFIVSSIIHMAPLWHKNDFPCRRTRGRAASPSIRVIGRSVPR
ncbi:MAG TPA: hypothetical protein VF505_10460 [Thermoanaerobaculia bacterium]